MKNDSSHNASRRIALTWSALAVVVSMLSPGNATAQDFGIGADVTSRYVWRGTDFGESASIQPALSISSKGFELGTWAAYSVSPEAASANEHDIWVSYTHETPSGAAFTVGATDYYFPSPGGLGFFEFDGDGNGAHWVEPFVSVTGPAAYPVSFMAAVFVHNDPDNSSYFELSYPVAVKDVSLGLTAGVVGAESALYGTTGAAIVNLGISAAKSIVVSESFSIPVSVSYILNPDSERSYLVFGVSL